MGSFDWDAAYSGEGEDDLMPADALLLGIAAELAPASAVDLGCGAGGNAIALARLGWSVFGVDVSPNAVRSATANARAAGVDARFEVADATSWTPTERVALVVSAYSLPPPPGRAAALANATRAVAPGGVLAVLDWDRSIIETQPFFEAADLPTVDAIVDELEGVVIERAEVVAVPAHEHGHDHDHDHDGSHGHDHDHDHAHDQADGGSAMGGSLGADRWPAALVVARRPS